QPAKLARAPKSPPYDASSSESRSTRLVLMLPWLKLYSPAVKAGFAPRIGSGLEVRMPRLPRTVLSQRTRKSLPPKSVSKANAGRDAARSSAASRFKGDLVGEKWGTGAPLQQGPFQRFAPVTERRVNIARMHHLWAHKL